MNITIGSGIRWRWIENYGLRYLLQGGVIYVYDQLPPATPDLPYVGRKLATVTQAGAEFTPGVMSGGALLLQQLSIGILTPYSKFSDWVLTGLDRGKAKGFRFCGNSADSGSVDYVGDYVRLDGQVGGALLLADPYVTEGLIKPIDSFVLTFAG